MNNMRSAECVCSYYGLRVCYKQTNKINKYVLNTMYFILGAPKSRL